MEACPMSLTSSWEIFLVGTVGGILLEILHWRGLLREGTLPDYAHNPFYWVVTALLALAGGLMAWLYFGSRAQGIVALHVGLSTPLILQKLTTTLAPTGAHGAGPRLVRFFKW
jgi:hypothetical protein